MSKTLRRDLRAGPRAGLAGLPCRHLGSPAGPASGGGRVGKTPPHGGDGGGTPRRAQLCTGHAGKEAGRSRANVPAGLASDNPVPLQRASEKYRAGRESYGEPPPFAGATERGGYRGPEQELAGAKRPPPNERSEEQSPGGAGRPRASGRRHGDRGRPAPPGRWVPLGGGGRQKRCGGSRKGESPPRRAQARPNDANEAGRRPGSSREASDSETLGVAEPRPGAGVGGWEPPALVVRR